MKAAKTVGRKKKPANKKVQQKYVYITKEQETKYLKAKEVDSLTAGILKDIQ